VLVGKAIPEEEQAAMEADAAVRRGNMALNDATLKLTRMTEKVKELG